MSPDHLDLRHDSMNIVIWLVIGALVGWIASRMFDTDSREGLIRNIGIGTVGALAGSWVFGLTSEANAAIGVAGILASIVGAVVLMAIARRVSFT